MWAGRGLYGISVECGLAEVCMVLVSNVGWQRISVPPPLVML